jgi:hypothetical protein
MTTASSTEAQRPPTERLAADHVCHCEKPQFRTRASGKWAIRSECAACGGLALLRMR